MVSLTIDILYLKPNGVETPGTAPGSESLLKLILQV